MPISRREFVLGGLGAGVAGAAGLVFARQPGDPSKTRSPPGPPAPVRAAPSATGGILVLLTLYGGNDGLTR